MKPIVIISLIGLLVLAISCNNQDDKSADNKKSENQTKNAGAGTDINHPRIGSANTGMPTQPAQPIKEERIPVSVVMAKNDAFAPLIQDLFPSEKYAINNGEKLKVSFVFFIAHSRMDIADIKAQLTEMGEIDTPFIILGILAGKSAIISTPPLTLQVQDFTHKQVLKLSNRRAYSGIVVDFRAGYSQGKSYYFLDDSSGNKKSAAEKDINEISNILAPLEKQNLSKEEFLEKLKSDPQAKLVFDFN